MAGCLGGSVRKGNSLDDGYSYGSSASAATQTPRRGPGESAVPSYGRVSVHFENTDTRLPNPASDSTYHDEQRLMPQQQRYQTYADETSRTQPSHSSVSRNEEDDQCRCEYLMFENFKWVKQRNYVVAKDGREYYDQYVVTYTLPNSNVQYDMFTYAEGGVHNGQIENKFPYLCGETLALHKLPPVNSLTNVCFYTPPTVDPNSPFHVQEEMSKSKTLTAVPLFVDATHQALVIRTYNNALVVQLMPTAYSEKPILSGTPLFRGVRRSICGTVGSMFSEFYYVINGSPCVYTYFSIAPREKHESGESDRMRVVVLDRRDRVDSEEWSADETVLNGIMDVAMPVLQRVEDKNARLDVRDILYVGVVNNNLQLTDAPVISKKYKPPKCAVVVVIDNQGVYATQIRDREIINQWVQKDSNVTYSILPRHFFDKPRSSIVRINTSDTSVKLKRVKSRESLI